MHIATGRHGLGGQRGKYIRVHLFDFQCNISSLTWLTVFHGVWQYVTTTIDCVKSSELLTYGWETWHVAELYQVHSLTYYRLVVSPGSYSCKVASILDLAGGFESVGILIAVWKMAIKGPMQNSVTFTIARFQGHSIHTNSVLYLI